MSPYNAGIYITLAGPTTVAPGTAITFTASNPQQSHIAYQWNLNGSAVTGATNKVFTEASPSNGNVYSCMLTFTPTCSAGYSITSNTITIHLTGMRGDDTGSSQPVISYTGSASLYPNPAHETVTLVANDLENGDGMIRVYDAMGNIVAQQPVTVANGQLTEQMDIRQLPNAIYLICLTDAGDKVMRIKFVKD